MPEVRTRPLAQSHPLSTSDWKLLAWSPFWMILSGVLLGVLILSIGYMAGLWDRTHWLIHLLTFLLVSLIIVSVTVYALRRHKGYLGQLSEHQRKVQELVEQVRFQDHLLESFRESLIVVNPHSEILYWGKGSEKQFGYSAAEMVGKSITTTMPGVELEAWLGFYQQVVQNGGWNGENLAYRKDGSTFWVESVLSILYDDYGEPAALVGVDRDITDRKQAEQAAEENRRRYTAMFQDSSAVMLLVDPNTGDLVDANPAACEYYGYPPDRLVGMNITQLYILPRDTLFASLAEMVEKQIKHFDFRHRLSSGEERDVEVHCGTINVNERVLIYAIVQDITERRRAEALQQESERRLLTLMENVYMVATTVDDKGRMTFCNEYLARLTGWSQDELIGYSFIERLVPAEDRQAREELFRGILQKAAPHHMEAQLLTRQGQLRMITWHIIPLRNPQGQVVGLAGLGEDVTDNRKMRQDMDRRMRELAALQQAGRFMNSSLKPEEMLADLVQVARLMLGSLTATILLHEPETKELVYAAAEGNFAGHEQPKVGERFPDIAGLAGWVIRQGQPVLVANLQKEQGLQTVDGSPHSLMAVPMTFKNVVIGVFIVDNSTVGAFNEDNLTVLSLLADFATIIVVNARLMEAERQQRRLLEESQAQLIQSEKMNAMGRLVAFLAHEINNPLQSLRSGFDLMLVCSLPPEKQREYIEVAHREVERLSGIVERVLGFYRRSSEIQSQVDLNLLLEETMKLVEKRFTQAGITIVREYAPDLPPISGFLDQLHQVFLNLILNALAAMPNGGRLELRTAWNATGNEPRVQVSVTDDGIGIAPDMLPHIFKPFYTTRREGSGLGLPISYSIVEKHGGHIQVESAQGRGSTFTIVLPLQAPPIPQQDLLDY